MRSRVWVSLLILPLLGAAACSETPESAPPEETVAAAPVPGGEEAVAPATNEATEDLIEKLEREWVAAITNRDAAMLNKLLAEEFVGTSPSAHVYYKPMAISSLENGTHVVKSMALDEVSANVFGDTAVAFTSQEEVSSFGGEDTSGHYHYTNVWLKRNGEWQVVASHGSRFAKPH
jgi:ketosteroid isomerase-like protein